MRPRRRRPAGRLSSGRARSLPGAAHDCHHALLPPGTRCALALAVRRGRARARRTPARAGARAIRRPESSFAIPALEIVSFDLLLSNFNRATSGSHDYDVSWHSIEHNLRGPVGGRQRPVQRQPVRPSRTRARSITARPLSLGLSYWQASALHLRRQRLVGDHRREDAAVAATTRSPAASPAASSASRCFAWRIWCGDHSDLPALARRGPRRAISPPVGFNRLAFGDALRRASSTTTTRSTTAGCTWARNRVTSARLRARSTDVQDATTAQVDYAMDYGLPGKPGYTYNRPFDYFNFEAALSSANGVENADLRRPAARRPLRARATACAASPACTAATTTSRRRSSTSRPPRSRSARRCSGGRARDLAAAGRRSGGIGYAAASTTLRDRGRDRTTTTAWRRASRLTLRVIGGDRASLDVAGAHRVAGPDRQPAGRAATTSRASRRPSPGASPGRTRSASSYVWSHRSAAFPASVDQRADAGPVRHLLHAARPAGLRRRRVAPPRHATRPQLRRPGLAAGRCARRGARAPCAPAAAAPCRASPACGRARRSPGR